MAEAVQSSPATESTRIIGPTFSEAGFSSSLVTEMMPLLLAHYKEIAHYKDIPLQPDWGRYQRAAEQGILRIYLIRHGAELVGYAVFMVTPNLHYSTCLTALLDILYLDPSLRGHLIGMRFLKWCDERLKELGVQVTAHHLKVKPEHNYGKMLERMGYE